MGEFTTPYQDPSNNAQAIQRTSGLAITSLVMALIFCCPLTTILAVIFGLIALATMGEKKGRGLALTAIVLGILFTIGSAYFYLKVAPNLPFVQQIRDGIRLAAEGPNDTLTAGFAGDITAFKADFTGAGATASDAEVQAFIDGLRSQHGEFVSCTLDQSGGNPAPRPGQAQAVMPYVYTFANGQVTGDAEIIFADQTTGKIIMKFSSITIETDAGDMTYPASP